MMMTTVTMKGQMAPLFCPLELNRITFIGDSGFALSNRLNRAGAIHPFTSAWKRMQVPNQHVL
jgi:hypothetical protein